MKARIRKICLSVLSAAMLLSACLSAAAFAEDYQYTIHIYAGNLGTIDGNKEVSVSVPHGKNCYLEILNGSKLSIATEEKETEYQIKLSDSKYFVKGFKKAGHETDNQNLNSRTIKVTEDQQYVIAYGIKSNLVSYTVRYMDANDKVLLPQATYYGTVGDKPVVSFRYVEGYQPTAYNETKTLSSKETDNIFTFRYTKVKQATTTVVTQTEGNDNSGQTANNGRTTNNSQTTGNQTGTTSGNRVDLTANQAAASQANNNPDTVDTVDLDDQEVPLASGEDLDSANLNQDNAKANAHHGWRALLNGRYLIIAAASLALLIVIIGLLVDKHRKGTMRS